MWISVEQQIRAYLQSTSTEAETEEQASRGVQCDMQLPHTNPTTSACIITHRYEGTMLPYRVRRPFAVYLHSLESSLRSRLRLLSPISCPLSVVSPSSPLLPCRSTSVGMRLSSSRDLSPSHPSRSR